MKRKSKISTNICSRENDKKRKNFTCENFIVDEKEQLRKADKKKKEERNEK